MASLILQSGSLTAAAVLRKRALIGRKAWNGVQLEQRAVSRIHAWIDRDGDHFYIADARSRGGTIVNDKIAVGKVPLHDGDVITVGPNHITFYEKDELPEHAIEFDIADDGRNPALQGTGIMLACACGAPMWVPASMAGAYGHCGVCNEPITVPGEPTSGIRRPLTPHDSIAEMKAIKDEDVPLDDGGIEFPKPSPEAAERICHACMQPIHRGEPKKFCPSCTQVYHADCWERQGGCVAYGCLHGADLMSTKKPEIAPAVSKPGIAASDIAAKEFKESAKETLAAKKPTKSLPWNLGSNALLVASICGTLVGAVTFGVPALLVGMAAAIYASGQRSGMRQMAAWSVVLCGVGMAVGIATSWMLWFNLPPWPLR